MNVRRCCYGRWFFGVLVCAMASAVLSGGVAEHPEIIKHIDVAPVWSVHRIGSPVLLTRDGFQYVAYYDQDRYLTLAQRRLGSTAWTIEQFPVQMGWPTGGHARLTLTIDRDGYIHLCSYRRGLLKGPPAPPEKIYYRSEAPHTMERFERLSMVSEDEAPHYPRFFTGPDGQLYFEYRAGGSGRGDQIYNLYDADSRTWHRLFDVPLLDGRGQMSAYGGPRLGPDGTWHAVWVWRNTPCNSTNHSLSYIRSDDMQQWQTVDGIPVELPVTSENQDVLVDPAGPGEGLSNVNSLTLGWDRQHRPVHTYHKFDDDGNSQVFNARFDAGRWRRVQATDWDFRWDYSGRGALGDAVPLRVGAVSPSGGQTLRQVVWSESHGQELIILDEQTLEPIERTEPDPPPQWRTALLRPESDFEVQPDERLLRKGGPMQVSLISDHGRSDESGVRYVLRWEHAGGNRDREVPKPWPQPTLLRVYKIHP